MRRSVLAGSARAAALLPVAALLVYFGQRELTNYDGYWHVFIARQRVWSQFWFEVATNAHPPLYYLVLKAAVRLGDHPLVYRLPSIVATVVAAALMGKVAGRLVGYPWLAAVAVLAFGLSASAIDVGLEVRAYALATCLTLAALSYYLDLEAAGFAGAGRRTRGLFVLFITLALLTHYSVVFVLIAMVLAPAGLAAVVPEVRARLAGAWRQALSANLLTFGGPAALFGLFYVVHASHIVTQMGHLPDFMFDPARETLVAFGRRTLTAEAALFSPAAIAGASGLGAAWAAGGLAVLFLAHRARCLQGSRWSAAALVPVMVAVMTGGVLAAAVVRRYPFGGPVRHQFFLFPFIVLSAVVALDWLGRILPAVALRRALLAASLAGCAVSAGSWVAAAGPAPAMPLQREMATFRALAPGAPAVYLDQLNLIVFYMHHHEWKWRLRRLVGSPPLFELWTVSKDGRRLHVCRDRRRWLLDPSDAGLYGLLAECLEATNASGVALFLPGHLAAVPPAAEASGRLAALAAKAGLRPGSVVVERDGVFGSFVRASAPSGGSEPIRVEEATYGARCRVAAGNATAAVQAACNGRTGCRYLVDAAALGDVAAGCAKDFVVVWRCGDREERRRLAVPAEAGFGSLAILRCE